MEAEQAGLPAPGAGAAGLWQQPPTLGEPGTEQWDCSLFLACP